MKTAAALFTPSAYENPEITAMAEISHILRDLPDDAARLRVMRWAFARYSAEFKRPVVETAAPVLRSVGPPVSAHPTPQAAAATVAEDMGRQVSELSDLFPGRANESIDPIPDLESF